MSQAIKKLQDGGTTTPTPVATPSAPKYKIKVNGNDYEMDEQSIRDKFNPIFTDLVQKGEAHERDRDKWLSGYNQIINNVKNGTYNINSSAGKVYDEGYQGIASNQALGRNDDGTVARKSVLGNVFARGKKNPAQIVSMLDGYFGNHVVNSYDQNQIKTAADAKMAADKAKADGDKAKATALDNIANTLGQDFGTAKFGGNWATDQGKQMVLRDQWWNKNVPMARMKQDLLNYNTNQYKQLFDSNNDKYKEDLKGRGIDIDKMRSLASEFYDPTTGKFKTEFKDLKSFEPLSNPFGTGGANSLFYDKAAYKSLGPDGKPLAPVDPNASKPLTPSGNTFTDGKLFWKDKDRKELMDGFGEGNKLYNQGKLFTGWHIHGGNPDDALTGWYANGIHGTPIQGQNYMNALAKSPTNEAYLQDLKKQYSQIGQAYDSVLNDAGWLKAGDNQETSDASYNLFADRQKNGTAPGQTYDATANYRGAQGKMNVQYITSNKLNAYGKPQILHMITLPGNLSKHYYGKLITDTMGNVTGMQDPNGNTITDPAVTTAIRGLVYDGTAKNGSSHNTVYDPTSSNSGAMKFTPATTVSTTNTDSRNALMKTGGKISKHQFGGEFGHNQNAVSGDIKPKEANVGDIARSITDSNYHISGSDKAELAALGLNLGGLAASFTGAGSLAGAGLGAAGSITQFGADTSREGFKWGNVGQLALSLGLDAASAIPGLGILAEGSKVGRTLAKTARFLIPAMQVAGLGKAAMTVSDLATGKKKISDLSMDDLRDLTNGIHAAVGGSRAITQSLGTQVSKDTQLVLANGKRLVLDEPGIAAINSADDKVAAAKSVASRLTGDPVESIQLDKKLAFQRSWNPLNWAGKQETANMVKGAGTRELKDITKYQGDESNGLLPNSIYRRAIIRSATRNPQLTSSSFDGNKYLVDPKYKLNIGTGDVDQTNPGVQVPKKWGVFGDYTRNTSQGDANTAMGSKGSNLGEAVDDARLAGGRSRLSEGTQDNEGQTAGYNANAQSVQEQASKTAGILDSRRILGSMFGMNKLDNERTISYQQVRNRLQGLTGTKSSRDQLRNFMQEKFEEGTVSKQVQDQIAEALGDTSLKGYVKFKKGGILKAQNGNVIQPWEDQSDITIPRNGIGTNFLPTANGYSASAYSPNLSMNGTTLYNPAPKFNLLPTTYGNGFIPTAKPLSARDMAVDPTRTPGIVTTGANKITLPKFNLNPVTMSELGRALATSEFNKGIDTRVERPMLTAPGEVPLSTHGNLYAETVANAQANNLVRDSQNFRTSDANTQMLGNLEAQRNAAQIRMQGAMQNNQTMEQTRQAAQNYAIQNNQVRANVANENIQTNARATQAERQANNEKRQMINQPIMDFWKDQNGKAYIQGQQNREIDTRIGGLGEESKIRSQMQTYRMQLNKVYTDPSLNDEQRQIQANQISDLMYDLQDRLTRKELEIRKNPYGYTPGSSTYYSLGGGRAGSLKEGGQVKLAVAQTKADSAQAITTSKEYNDSLKEGQDDQTKKQLQAMKDIAAMIQMALK